MSTILAENFDGVTAPALPSGWVMAAGYQTETSSFVSSPNGLANVTNNNFGTAYYNTVTDGNGGDAQASAWFHWSASGGGGASPVVLCRITSVSAGLFTAPLTCYAAIADFGVSGFTLNKVVNGVVTQLGASLSFAFSVGEKYLLYCRCVGTTIILRCQRASDGKWCDSSGVFQTGIQDAITRTDSAVSGAGKAGLVIFRQVGGTTIYADDFLWETVGSPNTRRRASSSFI